MKYSKDAQAQKDRKDQEFAWFDPVLAHVNGVMIWDRKERTAGSWITRFHLPDMPGIWSTQSHSDPAELLNPENVAPIRRVLEKLARNGRVTPSVWTELRELVGQVDLSGSMSLAAKIGAVEVTGKATVRRDLQWLALLVAELIHVGLDTRVRVCDLPKCDNIFVAWRTQGPSTRYCTTNHASQHRVERKRARDQQRKML